MNANMRADPAASLSEAELRRFGRHLVLPEFGIEGQRRLKAGSVLLIGLGGLGSPAALYLAAAGAGRIGLVDADVVEETNLQRQIAHGYAVLGKPKIESAEARMLDLNPDLVIERHPVRLDLENAVGLISQYDVIIDGTDNFPTRYLVNDTCVKLGKPNVFGGVLRFDGQLSVFDARYGPCYRCIFPKPPPIEFAPNCAEAGVLGVMPGVIGSLQATEAIKLLAGIGRPMIGRMLIYDGLDLSFNTMQIAKDSHCPICSKASEDIVLTETLMVCAAPVGRTIRAEALQGRLDALEPLVIVDVRSPDEWLTGRIPGSIGLPKPELEKALAQANGAPLPGLPMDQDIIVACQSGMRSSASIRFLVAAGYDPKRLFNLEQGMSAWPGHVTV
jgi:molybdopterin/thiamine biosynthesis adenylyltransferase/rhodanese-related sulfurtransferase